MTLILKDQSTIYTCEVRTIHIHNVKEDLQVNSDVWNDSLFYLIDYWNRPDALTLSWVLQLRLDLLAIGIPDSDIRVRQETYSTVLINTCEKDATK